GDLLRASSSGPSDPTPRRAPSAPFAYRRADRRGEGDAGSVNRLGRTDRLCETLVSWRLLIGGLSPGASHHSFTTSSEEPPLSNFNSYRGHPPFECVYGLNAAARITRGFNTSVGAGRAFVRPRVVPAATSVEACWPATIVNIDC